MTEPRIHHDDIDGLRELLVGRSIRSVSTDTVVLDDGRQLRLAGNRGCGGCGSGDYELTSLNDHPVNAIMDVQVVDEPVPDAEPYDPVHTVYRLFVLAQDERIELASFAGKDGNGYYGTGFNIFVTEGAAQ